MDLTNMIKIAAKMNERDKECAERFWDLIAEQRKNPTPIKINIPDRYKGVQSDD